MHTQLNYKHKLQVDQAVIVKPEVLLIKVHAWRVLLSSHDRTVEARIITRKRTVIGEVTLNFELAKPRGLCIHMSADFEWDPPRLIVYHANHTISSWGAFTLLTSRYFKIATSWSYHLQLREKSGSFSETSRFFWLVVRMCAITGYSACIHACSACSICMRAEDIDTRFKERA